MKPDNIHNVLALLDKHGMQPDYIEVSPDVLEEMKAVPYPELVGFADSKCTEFYGFRMTENKDLPIQSVRFMSDRNGPLVSMLAGREVSSAKD